MALNYVMLNQLTISRFHVPYNGNVQIVSSTEVDL